MDIRRYFSEINKLYQCKRYLRTYWETVIFFQCTAQEQCHNFHLPLKSDKNTPNRQFFHISLLLQVPWGETTRYKVVFARFKFFNFPDRLKCDQGTSNPNLKTMIWNHRKNRFNCLVHCSLCVASDHCTAFVLFLCFFKTMEPFQYC